MFFFLQRNGRIYKVGTRLIEIHANVINKLCSWNTNKSECEDVDKDVSFGLALLLSLVNPDEMFEGCISEEVMDFILGKIFEFYRS